MESSDVNNGCPSDQNGERRSRKIKNLEKEVEMILFQEESEDYEGSVQQPTTPSTSEEIQMQTLSKDGATPRVSGMPALSEFMQTPRRSCRKSIKPAQDYDDIIVKRSLRSVGKTSKNLLKTLEQENIEKENTEDVLQHKWTSAEVGKSSSKRGRKPKKSTTATKSKKQKNAKEVQGEHVGSQRKLEVDSTVGKEINEKNSPKNVFTSQLIDETVPQVISYMCEKNDYGHVQDENIQANEHVDTLNNETSQVYEVLGGIMPESVILSPKEHIKIGKEALNGDTIEDTTNMVLEIDNQIDSGKQENLSDAFRLDAPESLDCTHLIQEDSKDLNEHLVSASKEEECAFSGNLTRTNKNVVIVCDKDDKESSNDSFGSYLKSNKLNVTDLGLIPLKDEDDVEQTIDNIKRTEVDEHIAADEMPSLIVLDDDIDEDGIYKVNEDKSKLNETFEAVDEVKQENYPAKKISIDSYDAVNDSLQIFLQHEAAVNVCDEEMASLKMSEDEGTPRKASRIVLSTTDFQNHTILGTPKVDTTNPSTPKQKSRTFRFPTPHTNKVLIEKTSSTKKLPLRHTNMSLALTTMEPKEIVLRGIRKRSTSVCILGSSANYALEGSATKRQKPLRGPLTTHRQQKAVNFYSPANQTTIIEDIDRLIADNLKKDINNKPVYQTTNVTTRRKRSLSLDESMMNKSMLTKIPRPGVFTSISSSSSSSSSFKSTRTKLPNFAAIHQKHFQKMENLFDHVARKQERSKVLISSASKIKLASAQKNVPVNRNVKPSSIEPPRALKKINLEGSCPIKSKPVPNMIAITNVGNNAQKNNFKENLAMIETSKLPHPRDLPDPKDIKVINRHQQHLLSKKHLKPTQTTNVLANTKCSATTTLKAQQQKPFNLSTHIPTRTQIVKPTTSSAATSSVESSSIKTLNPFNLSTHIPTRTQIVKPSTSSAATSSVESSSNVPSQHTQDKMTSRLQRHMDLFKGRAATTRSGIASRKIEANIRGVRSNRRFELQMQHRRNLEK